MTEKLRQIIHAYENLIEEPIVKIILFGSFARGEETVYSDIDIALVSKGGSKAVRGSSYELKDAVEAELHLLNREVGWFGTNEFNLETSTEMFNTNTRIKKEGVLLWTKTVI